MSGTTTEIYRLSLSFVVAFVVGAIFQFGACKFLFLLHALMSYNQGIIYRDCSYSLPMVVMIIMKLLTEP